MNRPLPISHDYSQAAVARAAALRLEVHCSRSIKVGLNDYNPFSALSSYRHPQVDLYSQVIIEDRHMLFSKKSPPPFFATSCRDMSSIDVLQLLTKQLATQVQTLSSPPPPQGKSQ